MTGTGKEIRDNSGTTISVHLTLISMKLHSNSKLSRQQLNSKLHQGRRYIFYNLYMY